MKTGGPMVLLLAMACLHILPPTTKIDSDYERNRKMMKPSMKDETHGKLHEVKGKIEEEVGKATNDPNLEVSGKAEKKAGKVQKFIGRTEKAIGE